MNTTIRRYRTEDRDAVLEICIAAFTPIHEGFEAALGQDIFQLQYKDWKQNYATIIDGIDIDDDMTVVHVAEREGTIVGFIFTSMDAPKATGEIGLNAVLPELQGQGIGRSLYEFALEDLKRRGAKAAYVGTGGDAAHAPARRAYEAAGFDRVIPSVHLFRTL
jgi:ribosomal protein S18 acetylase RimI-like enzyme